MATTSGGSQGTGYTHRDKVHGPQWSCSSLSILRSDISSQNSVKRKCNLMTTTGCVMQQQNQKP
ncbi:GD15177 [Drosophila simulans]|uniref:GD15177 n=1 Tax=Drosophila simulans TaxID=7240 RepID=B4NTF2_DROSI|nr:GD15177 [Drosophila simulans]